PHLLRNEASDSLIRIDGLSRNGIAGSVEDKFQLATAGSELSTSHCYQACATPTRHSVFNNESCRSTRLFIPPDTDKFLQLISRNLGWFGPGCFGIWSEDLISNAGGNSSGTW